MIVPAEERVQNGVMFLNKQVPDWRERIRVESLDIGTTRQCILGQLFGDYFDGMHALDLYAPDRPRAADLGFVVQSDAKILADVKALNKAWRKVFGYA